MAHGPLMIGWSRGEITPKGKTLLQGQFYTRIADGTVSPLTATALAIEVTGREGETDHAIFLSCDLCNDGFKTELMRKLEGRCPGLDADKVTVNATHTHTGPCLRVGGYEEPRGDPDYISPDEYREWLAVRLAEIVETAWNTRQPGQICRGFSYAVVGRSRRAVYSDGTAQMYGRTDREDFLGFESCDDHAVNMLFTRDGDGELTGMLVNLACTAQCDESLSMYSADFWHDVRQAVEERYGPLVQILPQCAPSGDMSPHLLADQKEERELRNRLGVDDKGIIARRIMTAINEGIETASANQGSVDLVHEVKSFSLPRIMVTTGQYERERMIRPMSDEERKKQPFEFQRVWGFGLVSDPVARYEQQEENPLHEVESHIIRLGDAVFATNPFELFVEYGTRIRCRSRALQTFLVELADGSANGAYLPTQRALNGGHYSAVIKSNWVGPEGGKVLVDETVRAIDRLFEGEDYPRTR